MRGGDLNDGYNRDYRNNENRVERNGQQEYSNPFPCEENNLRNVERFGFQPSGREKASMRVEAQNCSVFMHMGLWSNVASVILAMLDATTVLGILSLVFTLIGLSKVKKFFTRVNSEENRKFVAGTAYTYWASIGVQVIMIILMMKGFISSLDHSSDSEDGDVYDFVFQGLSGLEIGVMLLCTVAVILISLYMLYAWLRLHKALKAYY